MSNYQLANILLGETVHLSISVLIYFAAVSACIHFIDEVQPKTPPTIVEPVPAIFEPVPDFTLEPVPAIFEPVPDFTLEPVPAILEPVPDFTLEPVPAILEPVPDFTLADLSIRELKAMASEKKVKNYGRMKKSQLVEALTLKD
jgi:hypothetical protein